MEWKDDLRRANKIQKELVEHYSERNFQKFNQKDLTEASKDKLKKLKREMEPVEAVAHLVEALRLVHDQPSGRIECLYFKEVSYLVARFQEIVRGSL